MGEWTRRNIDMDMLDISFFMEWTCFILILEYGMFMECDMGYFVFLWNMKTLWYFIFGTMMVSGVWYLADGYILMVNTE